MSWAERDWNSRVAKCWDDFWLGALVAVRLGWDQNNCLKEDPNVKYNGSELVLWAQRGFCRWLFVPGQLRSAPAWAVVTRAGLIPDGGPVCSLCRHCDSSGSLSCFADCCVARGVPGRDARLPSTGSGWARAGASFLPSSTSAAFAGPCRQLEQKTGSAHRHWIA